MTQQDTKNIQEDQGFISAEQNEKPPADLSVCTTEEVEFDVEDIQDISLEGNVLVITLKDGSEITIDDFASVMAATGLNCACAKA